MLAPQPAAVERPRIVRQDIDIMKMLTASALDVEHLKRLRFRIADPAEIEALGRKPVKTMVIPYFDLDGNEVDFKRYRYIEDPRSTWERLVTQIRGQRYFQPPDTGLHAYLPPLCDWPAIAADHQRPIIITEGEKKAASATAHGFPCVGLGGVDCFASRKEDGVLIGDLMAFKWEGRDVTIMYDSDAAENPNVLAASIRLGRKLFALGAKPRIASIPAAKDGAKQGVDDFIVAAKRDLVSVHKAMTELVGTASADLFEREIALYDFNRQFVYLRDLDRVLLREDQALLNPDAFVRRAYAAATHNEYKIKTTKDGKQMVAKQTSTADAWMRWEGRTTCKTLEFVPGAGEFVAGNAYNLWKGWPIEPKDGDASPWVDLLDKLFGNDISERVWFEQWCAYPLQNPGAKLKTACLLWSKMEGTGKSTVLECLRAIYGTLFAPMNDSAVDLQWTDWLVNKLLVGVDDISAKTRDDHAAKWKNLITSPRLTINKRHVSNFEINSHVNFIMTSNEPNALRLGPTDRRYFVQRVMEWGTLAERQKFFGKVYAWLDGDGPAALLHHLHGVDTKSFDPDAAPPLSMSKLDMQDLSRGSVDKWIDDLVAAPDVVLRLGGAKLGGDLWSVDDLLLVYNARVEPSSKVSRALLGMALSSNNVTKAYGGKPVKLTNGLQTRLYVLRNAEKWAAQSGVVALREHYEATRVTV